MVTERHKGVVALETTNTQFLKLKKGLLEYLAKNLEPEPVYFESAAEIRYLKQRFPHKAQSFDACSMEYTPSIEEPKPFSHFLFQVIDAKKLNDVDVYKKAQIDRKLFSKMKDADYRPSKETVFKLILGMELTLGEAKEFLENVGFAFSRASKTDLVVKYCIEEKMFDLFTVNALLVENALPIL